MIEILRCFGFVASIIIMAIMVMVNYIYYLHMFQLNSYFPERYRRWKNQNKSSIKTNFSTSYKIVFLLWLIVTFIFFINSSINQLLIVNIIMLIVQLLMAIFIGLHIKNKERAKKPLVYTKRINRMIGVLVIPYLVLVGILYLISNLMNPSVVSTSFVLFIFFVSLIVFCIFVDDLIYLSYYILKPFESYLTQKYYNDAKKILMAQPDLIKIGITGSYGKTSTKFILEQVLKTEYITLVTPHSYNTTLGVVRTVREYFSGGLEAFVAEMGAKKSGDIKEICDLVEPKIGIITAVGPQHLETFGSIENIIATKFELARAVGSNGVVIVNNDDANIRTGMKLYPGIKYITYGEIENSDAVISNITVSEKGSKFTVTYKGKSTDYQTRLLGKHNISNLTAGIVLGLYLGISEQKIAMGIRETTPVEHRLELKMQGNYYILDDAFNSNPVGANNALEVLKSFPNGQKVIMTPGMVELGSEDEAVHFAFGQHMAECVDVAILVGEQKTSKIKEGLLDKDFPEDKIIVVKDVFAGFAAAREIIRSGDILLIENDLPDNY